MIYKKKMKQNVGATAIEYGILSALIAVTTIIALQSTGTNLGTTYCVIANELSHAVGAGSTASGCSATSSSNSSSSSSSSSSSADSSGSSSSSADSSSSGSADSSSSSADSSGSSADSSQGFGSKLTSDQLIKSGFVYSSDFEDVISDMAVNKVSGITGIYDSNGDELTTTEELLNYINNPTFTADYEATQLNPTDHNILQISYDLNNATQKKLYIPDMSKVSLSNSDQTWSSKIDLNIAPKSQTAPTTLNGDAISATATFGLDGFTNTSPSNDIQAEKYKDLNGNIHTGSYVRVEIPTAYYD
jgi:Flp pilus assembly pilin Flp